MKAKPGRALAGQPDGDVLGLFESLVRNAFELTFSQIPAAAADDNGAAVVLLGLPQQIAAHIKMHLGGQLGDAVTRNAIVHQQLGMGIEQEIIEVEVLITPALAPLGMEILSPGHLLGAKY